jgi:hypothetical protein
VVVGVAVCDGVVVGVGANAAFAVVGDATVDGDPVTPGEGVPVTPGEGEVPAAIGRYSLRPTGSSRVTPNGTDLATVSIEVTAYRSRVWPPRRSIPLISTRARSPSAPPNQPSLVNAPDEGVVPAALGGSTFGGVSESAQPAPAVRTAREAAREPRSSLRAGMGARV